MSHIFISYSRRDKLVVEKFVDGLKTKRFVVWQDVSDLSAGDEWLQAIFEAIEQAAVVVVFWTQSAQNSEYVAKEIQHALKHGKKIIPVWLDQNVPLGPLSNFEAVVSAGFSHEALEKLTADLVKEAPRSQWQLSDFDVHIPMNRQRVEGMSRERIGGEEYIVVPLIRSVYSNAHIIAKASTIVGQVARIQLMLQCTGGVSYEMPRDVFESVLSEERIEDVPLVGLYVTGPVDPLDDRQYRIDPHNVAQYSDIINTTYAACDFLVGRSDERPTFQVFLQALVDMAFWLGIQVDRWWPIQLYKWHNSRYMRIADISPRQP